MRTRRSRDCLKAKVHLPTAWRARDQSWMLNGGEFPQFGKCVPFQRVSTCYPQGRYVGATCAPSTCKFHFWCRYLLQMKLGSRQRNGRNQSENVQNLLGSGGGGK